MSNTMKVIEERVAEDAKKTSLKMPELEHLLMQFDHGINVRLKCKETGETAYLKYTGKIIAGRIEMHPWPPAEDIRKKNNLITAFMELTDDQGAIEEDKRTLYHCSWDWIMRAVHRILDVHEKFLETDGEDEDEGIRDALNGACLQIVYEEVISFIEWYMEDGINILGINYENNEKFDKFMQCYIMAKPMPDPINPGSVYIEIGLHEKRLLADPEQSFSFQFQAIDDKLWIWEHDYEKAVRALEIEDI